MCATNQIDSEVSSLCEELNNTFRITAAKFSEPARQLTQQRLLARAKLMIEYAESNAKRSRHEIIVVPDVELAEKEINRSTRDTHWFNRWFNTVGGVLLGAALSTFFEGANPTMDATMIWVVCLGFLGMFLLFWAEYRS